MIRRYCTLFDINFLAKGLALYNSLLEHSQTDWMLYILCLDQESYNLLKKLNLEKASLISLDQIEDNELLIAKNNRNRTEYCWTLTPSLPLYLLNTKPEIDLITYLDSDLFFYSSPEQIFEEFGNNSILLIPHNLPPEKKEKEKVVGKYNVGMMIFRRDQSGLACLNWWRQQCNTWCYEKPEDGKLGDQKYLDYFEEKFSNVYILNHPGANLAGWNIKNYRGKINKINNAVYVNNKPLIFFHFSSYKLYHPQKPYLPNGPTNVYKYFLPSIEKKLIFNTYYKEIIKAYKQINLVSPNFTDGLIVRPKIIFQVNEIFIPLLREYLSIKKNNYIKNKKLVILEHNNGRLANQLWNYISIYAYALERKYRIENWCFNIYADYFNIPINNKMIKLFFYNRFNKGSHWYRRLNFYKLYSNFIKIILSKNIIYSGDVNSFVLPPSKTVDHKNDQMIKKLENSLSKNKYFCGWLFRNPEGIVKYHKEIVDYFKPKQTIINKINNLINPLRPNFSLIVGVHIRQTDFKNYANGNYYFSPEQVKLILCDFLASNNLKKNETVFIICSDEKIDENIFSDLNVKYPNGNSVEDLFTLSKTDLIIGTNSTYGAWAAFYGNIPIVFFDREKIDWSDIEKKQFNFPNGLYRNY